MIDRNRVFTRGFRIGILVGLGLAGLALVVLLVSFNVWAG